MNLLAAFLLASIGSGACSALDFTVQETVDIVATNGNVPPLNNREDETTAPRIVGGTPAPNGAYPWFGRAVTTYFSGGFVVGGGSCGASLVHPRVAVSAMHCVDKALAPTSYGYDVTLYFGANSNDGSDAMAVRSVKSLRYIPQYNFPFNDIVLYTWDSPITNIVPIAFNRDANLPSAGSVARAIGFGLTTHQGTGSNILLQVDLNVVAASVCNNFFTSSPDQSESELVCVQTPGKDICQGDSGGPLFTTAGGVPTLMGITSFSGRCGANPSGFAAPSHFQTFIDQFVCNEIGGGYCDDEDNDADGDEDGGILGFFWNLFKTIFFCF